MHEILFTEDNKESEMIEEAQKIIAESESKSDEFYFNRFASSVHESDVPPDDYNYWAWQQDIDKSGKFIPFDEWKDRNGL